MIDRDKCIVVVIDIQGRLAELVDEHGKLFDRNALLIKGAKTFGVPVLYTEQMPDKMGGTRAELVELLSGVKRFEKSSFSCCGADRFLATLSEFGRRQVLLSGIEAHICVTQTGLDLLDAGYEVYPVADAISARDPEQKNIALDRLRSAGAAVVSVEMLLYELMRDARDDAFREILGLIKDPS